ncbi:MAG: AmmeMemoRadiSam system protein A [Deltaproteobacteria bacterium]|jgi:AmmeMemoRadiSam system protein A|nr:AmmeMemoRadiSam system protein A [Deltaproteobacteria bacterium]MBW2542459.1 AmmeMemoRadiSam system protein A [Deltaproteobacteria bacterium]
MCSADRPNERQRTNSGKALLLDVARRSIESGLRTGQPLAVDPDAFPPELGQLRATFVTLRRDGELRGCVGGLVACRPLVADVAHSAYGAAFRDSRFPALEARELDRIEIHISILGPLEPVSAPDEKALLAAIRPGIDGLVVRDGARQGTFLPAVWESLPEPAEFWRELKRKAGIPLDAWSSRWEIFRYTVESLP